MVPKQNFPSGIVFCHFLFSLVLAPLEIHCKSFEIGFELVRQKHSKAFKHWYFHKCFFVRHAYKNKLGLARYGSFANE